MARLLDYNATLIERIDITDRLAIVRIQPDRRPLLVDGSWFRAGQYTTIGLNNELIPSLGSVRRPMSIASPPQEVEFADFYIRYITAPESPNPLTALLWQRRVGDRCYLREGAVGKFTVEDSIGQGDPRLRLLVAAGTGLAPFISMVGAVLHGPGDAGLDHYAILHGVSYPVELGYRSYLETLVEERGLRYLPTVSRPGEAPEWRGCTGRVEDFFKSERLAETEALLGLGRGELSSEHCVVYICGLQGTIQQTLERLLQRGFVPEQRKLRQALGLYTGYTPSLFWEQYDNAPIFNIKDGTERERLSRLITAPPP
jgi:ferredoxin--NADP+ reductase